MDKPTIYDKIFVVLDIMASSVTIENNFECPSKKDIYQKWQESASKIKFGEHEFYIELEGIDEFYMQKAKEELRETPEIVAESCTQLRELITGEPDLNVPNDEEFYKTFLRPCKYYPKSAFSLMKRYYQFRLNYPHIYADLLPSKEKTALFANLIYPLPFRAKDGSRILVIEGGKRWNPKEIGLNTLFRGLIIMLCIAMAEPKNSSCCFLLQMKRYYQFRLNYPHIYADLLPSKEKTALFANLIYPLPFRAKDGSRILVIEGGKRWNPKEIGLNTLFRGLIIMLCIAMAEPKNQISGARVIIDTEGLSLSHVTYITPSFAKMMLEFIQKCIPIRFKGIHIVKQSFFFKMAFAIFKPFLEEKIRKRIFFHGTNSESLMTFIDRNALLKRHGGELDMPEGSFGATLWENILLCEPFFEVDQHYGYKTNKNIK